MIPQSILKSVENVPANANQVINQGTLLQQLRLIFPGVEILQNVRKELDMKYVGFTEAPGYMEFDVWIPAHQLCFEFQDPHHYTTTWFCQPGHSKIQERDYMKKVKALEKGMYLVAVPCWWDGSADSLIGSIDFVRPDLELDQHIPISLTPPWRYFRSTQIPVIGELMLAMFPPDEISNFNTWWMGEKYDGMRCCWNPIDGVVYSRNGHVIELLPEIVSQIPKSSFFDGEIWFGRGEFSFTYSLVKSSEDINWPQLRMVLFDIPFQNDSVLTFEERFKLLLDNIPHAHPFAFTVFRVLCQNHSHMHNMVKGSIDSRGEGIMMRKRDSLYEPGRSFSLLKIKAAVCDMEAIVIGLGAYNSVILKLPNGKTFEVLPTNVSIPTPKSGDIVSFSSESLARSELPVNPKIFRIRDDVSWDDVLESYFREQQFLNASSKVEGFTTQPLKLWTLAKLREFMIQFAKNKNKDPFLSTTWYTIPYDQFADDSNGKSILRKFGGNYYKALQTIFPEMKLDPTEFNFNRSHWKTASSRRKFFESYAKINRFDPHDPEQWYSTHWQRIEASKGAVQLLKYHKSSVPRALLDLFPEISWKRSKFRRSLKMMNARWCTEKSRRIFFENYAKSNQFDMLDPKNWYTLHWRKIARTEGASQILQYHNNSVPNALSDLFPTINWDKSKFQTISKVSKDTTESGRNLFIKYAKTHQFDAYDPNNWYSGHWQNIEESGEALSILRDHNFSAQKALVSLFPDLTWDRSKFSRSYKDFNKWRTESSRRNFFENYALGNQFDPFDPENWYSIQRQKIEASKGAFQILQYHENRVPKALIDLFPELNWDTSKFKSHAKLS